MRCPYLTGSCVSPSAPCTLTLNSQRQRQVHAGEWRGGWPVQMNRRYEIVVRPYVCELWHEDGRFNGWDPHRGHHAEYGLS